MSIDDIGDSWDIVEQSSKIATDAFAQASLDCLRKRRPRQALRDVFEASKWFNLGTMARNDTRPKVAPPVPMVSSRKEIEAVRGALDKEAMTAVEAELAQKDADARAALLIVASNTATQLELEQYSTTTTRALHRIVYEKMLLPCECQEAKRFDMLRHHLCALRLDGRWHVPGDDGHCFFDVVLAADDNYDWTKIQFQIPRSVLPHLFYNIT
jgi:hypothetical protein